MDTGLDRYRQMGTGIDRYRQMGTGLGRSGWGWIELVGIRAGRKLLQ